MTDLTYCACHDWPRQGGKAGDCGEDLNVHDDEDLKHCGDLLAATPFKHPSFKTHHEGLDMISKVFVEYPDIIGATLLERRSDSYAVHFRRAPSGQTSQEFRDRIKENSRVPRRKECVDLFINNTIG